MKLAPVAIAVLNVLAVQAVCAQEELTYIEEVLVTANKIEQPISKTPGSVAVIQSDEIEKQGATELYDALNHEPGVSVTGGAGRPQNITIRGMTGNRIAIIKDGVKVSDGYGANALNDKAGRDSFDLNDVKTVEVVKGAGSSIHGSGAIGGVVVLTSKAPQDYLQGDDFYMDADATYTGISNKYKGSSTLAFRAGDTDSLLRASYWTGEETRNHKQDLYKRSVEGNSVGYTVEHFATDTTLLKGQVKYYQSRAERNEGSALVQTDGKWEADKFSEDKTTTTVEAKLGFELDSEHFLFDTLDSNIYWRNTNNQADINILMSRMKNGIHEKRRQIESRDFEDELIGLSATAKKQLHTQNTEHNLVYGLTLESNRHARPISKTLIDSKGVQPQQYVPFVEARTNTFGVYVSDVITWNNWSLIPSLRFDHHQIKPESESSIGGIAVSSQTSQELSPSLSLAYQFTPELNSYVSYNHGYRAPSYDKIYGYNPHLFNAFDPFIIIPNMDLEAETSDKYEIGTKYHDQKWTLYTALHYSKFKNFIDAKRESFNSKDGFWYFQYKNLDNVKTYGAEVTASYRMTDQWQVSTSAGITEGKDGDNNYITAMTPLEGNLTLDYQTNKLTSYLRINWAAAMDKTSTCLNDLNMSEKCAETDSWATADLGLSYELITDLNISLNVVNVLDKEYIRYQDVAGISEAQTKYSTEPGRYFTAHVKYQF